MKQNQWSAEHRAIRSYGHALLQQFGVDCNQYDFFIEITDYDLKVARIDALQKGSNRMIVIDRIEYGVPLPDGDWDSAMPRLTYNRAVNP